MNHSYPFRIVGEFTLPCSELVIELTFSSEVEGLDIGTLTAAIREWEQQVLAGAWAPVARFPLTIATGLSNLDIFPSSPRTVTIEISGAVLSEDGLESLLSTVAKLGLPLIEVAFV